LTTVPSIKAMLEPKMVAVRIQRGAGVGPDERGDFDWIRTAWDGG
jgi:hypothetical protein